MQVAKPTYIARAPRGKEVEELTPDEIQYALDNKELIQAVSVTVAPAPVVPTVPNELQILSKDLKGTLEAVLINEDGQQSGKIPVSELVEKLKESSGIKAVVFDGIVTGRLIDTAREKNIATIVGERVAEGVRIPRGVEVRSFNDLN
jgi:DNA primase